MTAFWEVNYRRAGWNLLDESPLLPGDGDGSDWTRVVAMEREKMEQLSEGREDRIFDE